ncbi:DUF2254 domain-containing protein [Profundibacterium mesophilum]|nr:DUF2254 domain-containing protein [Profundibacterium mesophilum]
MKLGAAALSKRFYQLRALTRKLWIRAALIAGLAVVAALVSRPIAPLVPQWMAEKFSAGDVSNILEILASSMLAVTIFSLSVMVSARQSASSQVTPRSHQVLIQDTTTQTVLATFLGAFVFALVGLIVLGTGVYSGQSPTVILFFTLLVIGLVVVAILRWIDHLSDLGSVVATSGKIEDVAQRAIDARNRWPCLGARPLSRDLIIPGAARELLAWETGYVQHIDLAALEECCKDGGLVYILRSPGTLASEGTPILRYAGEMDVARLRHAFTLSTQRNFDQDPRFGAIVLSEIAQRALSPGINDPGTAIDVLSRLQRVLHGFRAQQGDEEEIHFPHVWMEPVSAEDLMRDAIDPIARDGAGNVEVQVRLHKMLREVSRNGDAEMRRAAQAASARALGMALPKQLLDEHCERLRALALTQEPAEAA